MKGIFHECMRWHSLLEWSTSRRGWGFITALQCLQGILLHLGFTSQPLFRLWVIWGRICTRVQWLVEGDADFSMVVQVKQWLLPVLHWLWLLLGLGGWRIEDQWLWICCYLTWGRGQLMGQMSLELIRKQGFVLPPVSPLGDWDTSSTCSHPGITQYYN